MVPLLRHPWLKKPPLLLRQQENGNEIRGEINRAIAAEIELCNRRA
jgi:hypothetical protein